MRLTSVKTLLTGTMSIVLISCQAVSSFASISKSSRAFSLKSQHPKKQVLKPYSDSKSHRASGSLAAYNEGLNLMMALPRGGASVMSSVTSKISAITSTPSGLFNTALVALALTTATFKVLQRSSQKFSSTESNASNKVKPKSISSLQIRYLTVFWLIRCADWLQGPYFYEVYASKVFHGVEASMGLVSKLFLTGFASTALFGPLVGRAADIYGRKRGTLAFCLIYALGAASTKSPLLSVLLMGRVLSGIGTSLLFSAPESWLVGESQKSGDDPDGTYLGETFGRAYAGDAIVAILAGQFAGAAAGARGPTGPFELSTVFLAFGGLLTAWLWNENVADVSTTANGSSSTTSDSTKPSIRDAVRVVAADPNIILVGAVQSLFEAAMYIFVLQWPPAISSAVKTVFGASASTPYGTVFSCFMASCLLGSTLFGQFAKMGVPTEVFTTGMLGVATIAMGASTLATSSNVVSLSAVVAGFFAFEACVGMYFPSIGTLRSKYVPDSHRGVIMNLFGIPLNALVVSVFLSMKRLGLSGALGISTGALGLATIGMFTLQQTTSSLRKPVASAIK